MNRTPIILGGLTAVSLIACSIEYGLRGLNPDVDSECVLHPAWWQSDVLADGGFYLRACSVLLFSPFERFLGGSFQTLFVFCLLLQLVIFVVLSFVVFYVARLLLHPKL